MSDDKDERQTSKSSFNLNARLIDTGLGTSGGMLSCVFSLAMPANAATKQCLAGAVPGVMVKIEGFVQGYRLSTQAEVEQSKPEGREARGQMRAPKP